MEIQNTHSVIATVFRYFLVRNFEQIRLMSRIHWGFCEELFTIGRKTHHCAGKIRPMLNNRVFPYIDHSVRYARIVLEKKNLSKKLTSNRT